MTLFTVNDKLTDLSCCSLCSVPAGVWFFTGLGESSFIGSIPWPNPTTYRYITPILSQGVRGWFDGFACHMCMYGAQNERFRRTCPRSAKPQTDTPVKSKVKGHWLENSYMCVRERHRADLNAPNGEGIPWRFHELFALCVKKETLI